MEGLILIKLKEIAEMAGVSPATVSNVLNGRKNVSEEVRQKILALCEDTGYQPPIRLRKPGRTRTVVFNFSDFDRSFYLNIIKGISECLTESHYDLIVCTNRSSKNFMRSRFSEGAISLDGKITDEELLAVAQEGYPVIVMDRLLRDEHIKSVVVDNYPVMCDLVQRLVAKGYQRFGYVGGTESSLDNRERFSAFEQTLKANDILFDKKYYFHGDYREKSGYQAARLMLLGNVLPQVVVCASDNMALGAIRAFREYGLEVPKSIAVTGFDDCDAAGIMGLTTVAIPRYESGYLAAKELLNMIEGAGGGEPFKISASVRWRGTA